MQLFSHPVFEKGLENISSEDDATSLLELLNNPSYEKIIEKSIKTPLEEFKLGLQILSNPDFLKAMKNVVEDPSLMVQFLNNPSYQKILEKLMENQYSMSTSDAKSYIQFMKNPNVAKLITCCKSFNTESDFGGLNISTMLDFGKMAGNFITNNNVEFENFGKEDEMKNGMNMIKKIEKTYVFNTIFEIIKTEGCKKIFQYTFSEAAKIMRSSKIIKSTLL